MISTVSENKVYHKDGCPYIKKMRRGHKKWVSLEELKKKAYHPCSLCGGVRGWAKIFHKRPQRESEEKRLECWYDDAEFTVGDDTIYQEYLYILSSVGFWKLYWKDDIKQFILFHRNWLDPGTSRKDLVKGPFHRQWGVSSTENFDAIVNYIHSHDRNKEIAAEDYRKLPRNTKRQKRHYKHHKKMAEKAQARRLDELFKEIESSRK